MIYKIHSNKLLQISFGLGTLAFPSGQLFAQTQAERPTLHVFSDTRIPVDIRLNSGELTSRYKLITDANGKKTVSQLEDRVVMDVTVLILKDGRVKLNFLGSTGSTFQGSFSNTDIGPTGQDNFEFNLRRMSLTYSPFMGMDVALHDLELTGGSFGADYGAGSEDTYFDNDGYIMGYRAKVSVSPKGYLSVTGGYVGDLMSPDAFERLNRMNEFNYMQVLLNHSIGAIAVGSFDFTRWEETNYARGAIKLDLSKWTKLMDSLVVEDLARLNSDKKTSNEMAHIFAVKISKKYKALLPGARDLSITLAYIYNEEGMNFPMGDRSFIGNQMRVSVVIPNLKKFKHANLAWFAHFLQSLEDYEQFRVETGLSLLF